MDILRSVGLFAITALAEILGCWLPYLWLRQGRSAWLLLPAALSLAVFVWLLTLHPQAAGRVYAAYGGVYVSVALLWLWAVEGQPSTGHGLDRCRRGALRPGDHHCRACPGLRVNAPCVGLALRGDLRAAVDPV
jgi:small multidrug resistance family-3 protein